MFEKLLAALARSLDSARIPYMVIGGQAVSLHGEPRFTLDIDVTVAADPNAIAPLVSLITRSGWKILCEKPEEFAAQTFVLPCEDPKSGVRFDFIFGLTPYEHAAMTRAKTFEFEGIPVRFAAAEDLVVQKIMAGRPRDLDDVKGVLLKNPSLDRGFVEKTLVEFARDLELPLLETWRAVLKDAGP